MAMFTVLPLTCVGHREASLIRAIVIYACSAECSNVLTDRLRLPLPAPAEEAASDCQAAQNCVSIKLSENLPVRFSAGATRGVVRLSRRQLTALVSNCSLTNGPVSVKYSPSRFLEDEVAVSLA
jgi:hypothetical protein